MEKTDSAELVKTIERRCKIDETEAISCDIIEDTNIELDITHHRSERDAIRSHIATEYTRTEPNNQRSVSNIETVITSRLGHAIAQGPMSEDETNDILIILYSKLAQE